VDDPAREARAHASAARRRRPPRAPFRHERRDLARDGARGEEPGRRGGDDRRPLEGPGVHARRAEVGDDARGRRARPVPVHRLQPVRPREGGAAMTAAWRRRLPALVGAFLFAAANLVFYVVYGSGAHSRRDALEARRTALARTVGEAEAEAARLTAQKERLS